MFAGSGTTGIAALAEGCRFLGVELDRDDDGQPLGYSEIIEGRIRHALTEYPATLTRTDDT
jgi:site-specific DNA-methyltransferase (adenine-specific)